MCDEWDYVAGELSRLRASLAQTTVEVCQLQDYAQAASSSCQREHISKRVSRAVARFFSGMRPKA